MEILAALRPIDRELAFLILSKGGDQTTAESAALASFALAKGDSCIDLSTITEEILWPDHTERPTLPTDRKKWIATVRNSLLVGDGTSQNILTLRDSRLYLSRYFQYEQTIVNRIRAGMHPRSLPQFSAETTELMKQLFKTTTDFSAFGGDLQLAGSLIPLFFPFSIISGGPGTGKTTTVAKLLALRLSHEPSLRIALAAPTGKAAQRMNESIKSSIEKLNLPKSIEEKLTLLQSSTIHRLLGVNHLSPTFKKNRENPLEIDLIVVDEASMIDLPLLAKLIDAVPETAAIILLGDQFQLASVEAGSVLGDLCASFPNNSFSHDFAAVHGEFSTPENRVSVSGTLSPVVQLTLSFRFDPNGGVGLVSRKINEGDSSIAATLLPRSGEVQLTNEISPAEMIALTNEIRKSHSASEALSRLNRGMILALRNDGTFGQETINTMIINSLKKKSDLFVHNMPIMITENSYERGLFNGDMGVLRLESGQWIATFPDESKPKQLPVVLLPQWQSAFAITIHKSQGSEYGKIIILPGQTDSPLFTRELIYTAITRAKPVKNFEEGSVIIQGTAELLAAAIDRRVCRASGLREELIKRESESEIPVS